MSQNPDFDWKRGEEIQDNKENSYYLYPIEILQPSDPSIESELRSDTVTVYLFTVWNEFFPLSSEIKWRKNNFSLLVYTSCTNHLI